MIKLVKKAIPVVAAAGIFLNIFAVARADVLRAPGGGTVRVVVIGVNHYPNLGDGAQLRGAAPDALDIAAALEKDGVHTVPILDGQVTRQRIVDAMNDLIKNSKKGDLAIISYAGHGMQTPEYPRWKGLSRSGASEQIALSNFSFAGPGAGEIIVNIEMRAWLSRLDAKGVDTVLVMDSCFGGGMRGVDPRSGELRVREVKGAGDAAEREKFTGIPMTDKEARADVALMPHVTFLSGATSNSVVPEMSGLPKDPSHPRGALSYYVARALEGGGVVTRKSLFQNVLQNVRQSTNGRQAVDIVPRSADPEILGKQIFVFGEPAAPTSVRDVGPDLRRNVRPDFSPDVRRNVHPDVRRNVRPDASPDVSTDRRSEPERNRRCSSSGNRQWRSGRLVDDRKGQGPPRRRPGPIGRRSRLGRRQARGAGARRPRHAEGRRLDDRRCRRSDMGDPASTRHFAIARPAGRPGQRRQPLDAGRPGERDG